MNIVILDGYAANPGDLSWHPLQAFGTLTVYDRTPAELVLERARDAEVIVTNKVRITSELLNQLPRLRFISVLATGYDIIDLTAARSRGIDVANVPAYSTASVAQLVFAHLLNLTHRVAYYNQQVHQGRWTAAPDYCFYDTALTELADKTIGIVGLGSIGSRVAAIAHAFGMNVLALTSKPQDQLPVYINKVMRAQLLAESDVLTLHCPLNSDTRHLISADALAQMKPQAILINTGRGPLVDEQAVADALQSGQLQAYCADVMESEPPRADNPLLSCQNAYLTPHIAWATREARQRLLETTFENVRSFAEGHPQNIVNP